MDELVRNVCPLCESKNLSVDDGEDYDLGDGEGCFARWYPAICEDCEAELYAIRNDDGKIVDIFEP